MKKALSLLLTMVLSSHLLYGIDFVADGLAYKINPDGESVTVTYHTHDEYSQYNYYSLTTVSIPDTIIKYDNRYIVTGIDDETFQDCILLTSVSFPASLKKIGDNAFRGCTSLENLNLPPSLNYLSPTAFNRCSSLKSITVDDNNTMYDSREGCNAVIETTTNKLILGCLSTVIPAGVTEIGQNAFIGTNIASVHIPSSVTRIGEDAFDDCPLLTSVHIDDIASWCSIDFANEKATPLYPRYIKVTTIYNPHNPDDPYAYHFYDTYIKEMHLYVNNQEIIDLIIPDGVTTIKPYAFGNCSYLQSVYIPSSVESIGKDAFCCLKRAKTIYIDNLASWCNIDFATMGSNPLYGLYYRYETCRKETGWTGEYYTGTEIIDDYAIKDMYLQGKKATTLNIPDGVTQIKPFAFVTHSGFNSVVIPSSVTSIGANAFMSTIWYEYWGADALSGVIKELVWNAKSCNSTGNMFTEGLESLTIGNEVETLPEKLAVGSKVTSLSLPASVRQIGNNAFQFCADLRDIYAQPSVAPSCLGDPFRDLQKNYITLHTTSEAMASYFSASVWKEFNNLQGDLVVPTQLTLDKTTANVKRQSTLQLHATVTPSNASVPVMWRSSDPSIATVNANGLVSGIKDGETDIIATCFNLRAVCHVVVADQLIVVTLDKHQLEMNPNEIATLVPSISGGTANLMVTSNNEQVAIARMSGNLIQVLAISPGEAVITVKTASGVCQPDSCKVIVKGNDALPGDVNNDGVVDIADVNMVINMMLGKTDPTATGDVNGDGQVDISDVNAVINSMLGKENTETVETIETVTVNGVTFKMVNVKGGTFTMGATEEQLDEAKPNEFPAHEVTLSDFSIGQTEVTQELWQAVMGNNPSYISGDPQLPVEHVSWEDCKTFILALSELTGQDFRLPTEAEWEYAARGGIKGHGYKYAGGNTPDEIMWYNANSDSTTHHVATKQPNELGLYDMSGNVWEWCRDWFGDFTDAAQISPIGPDTGEYRINRGGSWYGDTSYCRVSRRNKAAQDATPINCGLRLAK